MKKSPRPTAPPRTLSKEAKARWRALVAEYAIEDAAGLQVLATYAEAFDRMRGALLRDQFTHARWRLELARALAAQGDAAGGRAEGAAAGRPTTGKTPFLRR